MLKRLLLVALFASVPLVAHADTSDPNAALSAPTAVNGLGPSANGVAPTTGSNTATGSSSADGTSLQPAGNNPLQSTSNDSTGLTAPDSNTLQAPAPNSEQLQVINNDADGGQQSPADTSPSPWGWLFFSVLIGLIAIFIAWMVQLWRRRSARMQPVAHDATVDTEPTETKAPEPTSSQRLRITIDRPVGEVFKFVLNPENTPKWVDVIAHEEANEHPTKLGTIYTNRDAEGNESEYRITDFTENETFTMSREADGYHVTYTLTPADENATELEYYEWVDEGLLNAPFTGQELHKLKSVMETPAPAP